METASWPQYKQRCSKQETKSTTCKEKVDKSDLTKEIIKRMKRQVQRWRRYLGYIFSTKDSIENI